MKTIGTYLLLLFLLLLTGLTSYGQTYTTIQQGYWSDSTTWLNGVVPPFTYYDTVIIKHHISYRNHITLDSSAYMEIEAQGGLCGHSNIYVKDYSLIMKYGFLQCDSLRIITSSVQCYPPEPIVITDALYMTNGPAAFDTWGSGWSIGIWQECGWQYVPLSYGELHLGDFKIYPNPVVHDLNIETPGMENAQISIYNLNGELVYQEENSMIKEQINISHLPKGLYLLSVFKNGITSTNKFIKE